MSEYQELPVTLIERDPNQPRQNFDSEKLADLAASIKEHGLIQPIAVYAVADGRYRIVYGERRWLAAKIAGLETIPAIVREEAPDAERLFIMQVIENEYQERLTPIEEGRAFQFLLHSGVSKIKLAFEFNRSQPYIQARLDALALDEEVQDLIEQGLWPIDPRATKALLSIPNKAVRVALAAKMASPRVNIPTLQAACAAARVQVENAGVPAAASQPAANGTAEALRVMAENGVDATAAVPQDKRTWSTVRTSANTICGDCAWKSTAGVSEPAWTVILQSAGHLCRACTSKIHGDLTICRDCPAPLLLAEMMKGVGHVS